MRRTMRRGLSIAAVCGGLTGFASAAEGRAPRVQSVETERGDDARTVRIETRGEVDHSVFELADPFRILVDVAGASFAAGLGPQEVEDGVIREIRPVEFEDGDQQTARIEIELTEPRRYDVKRRDGALVIRIEDRPAKPVRLGKLRLSEERDRVVLVASSRGDLASDAVAMESIEDPNRIVIDLRGASIDPKYQRVGIGRSGIRRARVAGKPDGVRIVLDVKGGAQLPEVTVDTTGEAVRVIATAPKEVAPTGVAETSAPEAPMASEAEPAATGLPGPRALEPEDESSASVPSKPEGTGATAASDPPAQARSKPPAKARTAAAGAVEEIRFEPKDGFVRLTVVLDRPGFEVRRSGRGNAPKLFLPGVRLPERFERTLDVTEVSEGAVSAISSYNAEGGVVLAAGIFDETEHRHWSKDGRLMWDFRTARGPQLQTHPSESTAAYRENMASALSRATPGARKYRGRRISLDLKDADIQNVLRLLSDVSKLNIVAGDDVQGSVTIKLRNVPWDQALDIILSSRQLDKVRNGNIIRVAPIEVLRKEEELRLERRRAREELEPLKVRLIPVSYAAANDIEPQVTSLLSSRGKVNIDERTNVLIVEDIDAHLVKIERLVRTLDTQTPQVLIESRIVEARNNFSRELGIQWGGSVNFSQQFGNQTGLDFPSNVIVSGGADDQQNNQTGGVQPTPQYAVNLPATVGSGGGGALGFILGSVDGSAIINLRLSAAEAVGRIKLVSAPKIVTMDNKEARILSGEKVPITVITANGPTTRFINANLELGVTPHVTQDGAILMKIEAKKNELSDRVDFLGVPGILTNEATTEMIVQDGDTAVLGGLYRRNTQENEAYVPWIGKVPVLGWLFKTTSREDTRNELLIFISPRIVNRQSALVRTEGG